MFNLLIITLGIIGILLCLKIYNKKKQAQPLVCMLGADCNTVLKSDFSTFFGIKLELLGMVYYTLIAASYALVFSIPSLQTPLLYFILFGISFVAFLFSGYLISIQAFALKSWCSWCLISAGVTTLILISSILGVHFSDISFIPILEAIKHPLVILHLLGFALGVGGATINDVLFFRFLKDYKISESENEILKMLSQIIWAGLAISIISGLGLYLPNAEALNESSKFLLKVIVVAVVTINGIFLNLSVAPHLVKLSFNDEMTKTTQSNHLRKMAFASGAVSFVSWYSAFFLGTVKSLPFSLLQLIGIYAGLLCVGIIIALITEKKYCTQPISTKEE